MQTQATRTGDQAVQTTLSVLKDLLGQDLPGFSQQRNFAVRLWNGTTWQPDPDSAEPKRFTLVLQQPGALRRMFLPPSELNLGEAYIYNDFDIEGDITYRTWRLYIAGSAYSFQVGRNNIYQALLAKSDGGESCLPLTRADWYA